MCNDYDYSIYVLYVYDVWEDIMTGDILYYVLCGLALMLLFNGAVWAWDSMRRRRGNRKLVNDVRTASKFIGGE